MRRIYVGADHLQSERQAARYIIERWFEEPLCTLGGATGNTQRPIYRYLFELADERDIDFRDVRICFLDEYLGCPVYYHYALQHLRVGHPLGFLEENIWVPRGCFYDDHGRLVNSNRLEQILREAGGEWEARTVPGEDGVPPEIFIRPDARHPILRAIRDSNLGYEEKLRTEKHRLQLLGINRHGHIGFCEPGSARPDSTTMLVRLSAATRTDNDADFSHHDADGNDVQLERPRHAITQGISSILSANELLLSAHGRRKQHAVRRMFLAPPSPRNPAGYITTHSHVSIFLDVEAFGDLNVAELELGGFEVVHSAGIRASVLAKVPGNRRV